jgi:hypothetical protein
MGETLVRGGSTIEPVKLTKSEWAHLNQEVDQEVA